MPQTRRQLVFFILGGFFLANALVAEVSGGKLFSMPAFSLGGLQIPGIPLSIGVIPWPVVFITTDLVNEYYGRRGVRYLTHLTVGMIGYAFVVLYAAMLVPAWEHSPVSGDVFRIVFGQSMWIIVGSLTAFLIAQLVDVVVFLTVKQRTGHRMLWLRATGSTAVSQLVDSFVVGFIGFVVPRKLTFEQFVPLASGNYLYKLTIAVLITPVIYLVHGMIDRYLGRESAGSVAAMGGGDEPRGGICGNPVCAVDLPAGARFCPACGQRVTGG